MKDFIFKIDHWFGKLFHDIYLWGGDVSNFIMKWISLIAEAGILFLLIGFGLCLFKRTRKIGATIIGAVGIGFIITNIILKNSIARPRPFSDISGDFYKWWLDAGAIHETGYSFPSGHTTATTALAMAIFLTTNKKRSWPILLFPILMACSRIYLMVHYFSDCLGGLIVGSASALIAYLIVKLIYCKNYKLFVWFKELDLFKSKSKPQNQTQTQNSTTVDSESAPFEYVLQKDEPNKQPEDDKRLIEKQIEDSKNESTES